MLREFQKFQVVQEKIFHILKKVHNNNYLSWFHIFEMKHIKL